MKKLEYSLENKEQMTKTAKALSSEVRLAILSLLGQSAFSVNEIAEQLSLPQSSAVVNVRMLEEAGLILTELEPGVRGSRKLCKKSTDTVLFQLSDKRTNGETSEIIRMPIGSFVDYKVAPTCGIVSAKGFIDEEDEPRCFYNPARSEAKLIWLGAGYLEYRFPNHIFQSVIPERVEISAELCAEDHEYNMNFPSEITLWVNGVDAGTWHCPGDFGGRRGKLNPGWWPDKNTQYGELKVWRIESGGTWLDEEKMSEQGLDCYGLADGDYISVRIGIKENAEHIGGINLFGDQFGDYPQDILMKIYWNEKGAKAPEWRK